MQRPRTLLAAVAALVLWLVLCLVYYPPRIESALLGAAVEALTSAGLSGVRPEIDGRDLALVGTVASPESRSRAAGVAARVAGILTVDNRLVVDAPVPEPLPRHLEIRSRPEGVELRGTVPSEALREELLARARELYGTNRVDARLAIDAAADDGDALAGAVELLGVLAAIRQPLVARLDGDALRLSGTVPSVEARMRIEEQAQAAAPRLRLFFSTLAVAPPAQAPEPTAAAVGEGEE